MTQKEQIINHVRKFGSISQLRAAKDYAILRLSQRIIELERRGWVFEHETESNGKTRWTEYRLKKEGV